MRKKRGAYVFNGANIGDDQEKMEENEDGGARGGAGGGTGWRWEERGCRWEETHYWREDMILGGKKGKIHNGRRKKGKSEKETKKEEGYNKENT